MTSIGQNPGLIFKGIDGSECEDFIASLEELAFAEGWSQDRQRMILYARSRLRGDALRWFATLDPSIQGDWNLFLQALLNRYPSVTAHRQALIESPLRTPTVKKYNPSAPGQQIGFLRVVNDEGIAGPSYIWRGPGPEYTMRDGYSTKTYSRPQHITITRQEALVVTFIASSEPHQIGCLNFGDNSTDLAVQYASWDRDYYHLCGTSGVTKIKESHTSDVYPVSSIWNVLADGGLQATLSVIDKNSYDIRTRAYIRKEDFTTTEVHLDTSATFVAFVKPGTLLRQDDPKRNGQLGRPHFKARIVFEPL